MYGREIEAVIRNIPLVERHFLGTFMIDELPLIKRKIGEHNFAIINTAPSESPGRHWFTLYRASGREYEIFDPLGFPSLADHRIFSEFEGNFSYNRTSVQSRNSSACGQFCITFAVHRIYNIDVSLDLLLNELFVTRNLKQNENFAVSFCLWIAPWVKKS